MPKEVKLAYCKCLETWLDKLTLEIASLTKSLVGKGIIQAIEYEEELVHNAPAVAQNSLVPRRLRTMSCE